MSARAKLFCFESYRLDHETKELELKYSVDGRYTFTERWLFDFDWVDDINESALDQALFLLHILAGISYYKAHLASTIEVRSGQLTHAGAEFFAELYQEGLGQFFYTNQLDPFTPIPFVANATESSAPIRLENLTGVLLPIGGGKDSLVSAHILEQAKRPFTAWVVNHTARFSGMLDELDCPVSSVRRQVDPRIGELNAEGAYNGHIPITAIITAGALVSALLLGKKTVLLSNESSSSEGNVGYRGAQINHQYSKSLAVEQALADYIATHISPDLEYFSLLRPLSELMIGRILSTVFTRFSAHFSSCNQNFRLGDTSQLYWCGQCSKCAFVYLILAPFVPKQSLNGLFAGQDLFAKPELTQIYNELFGNVGFKPFECVGEVAESRFAGRLSWETGDYPSLERFGVAQAEPYDWQSLRAHRLNETWLEVVRITLDKIAKV